MAFYLRRSVLSGILILYFALPASLIAQEINPFQDVFIASPNAASLAKFADIPVNYHTGIPNISIPLYTVKEGPLELPISLSYHASGLKVMEQASWTGAGWSLNAGGMITRTIQGRPDELYLYGGSGSYLRDNGYFSYLYEGIPPYDEQGPDWYDFSSGKKDGEPDLFFFNFSGYSGKFHFKEDGSVAIIPANQDLHIEPLFCDGNGCNLSQEYLYGWAVTTPDGIKYYFGKTVGNTGDIDAVERTSSYYENAQSTTVSLKTFSSWYLYKIESPDNQWAINLSYTEEKYAYYSLSLSPEDAAGQYAPPDGITLIKNSIDGLRLSEITFTNGSVRFVPHNSFREDLSRYTSTTWNDLTDYDNDNAKSLSRIEISNDNDFCKVYEFKYDYFVDNSSVLKGYLAELNNTYSLNLHTDKKRLKLLSLQEKSCDGSMISLPYQFTYFEGAKVPRNLSFAQDHWGYYNGADANEDLTPKVSTDGGTTFSSGADREGHWPQMKTGVLEQVIYPTGGTANFVFGNHTMSYWHCPPPYTNCGSQTREVGGLRIEELILNEGLHDEVRTNYQYVNEYGEDTGTLFGRPNYIYILRNEVNYLSFSGVGTPDGSWVPGGCKDTGDGTYLYLISPSSVHPLRSAQGYHLGYSEVKVVQADGGYEIYKYKGGFQYSGDVSERIVDISSCDPFVIPEYPPQPEPYDPYRGELEYHGVFHVNGNPVQETFYASDFSRDLVGSKALRVQTDPKLNILWAKEYDYKSYKKAESTVIEKIYNPKLPEKEPVIKRVETIFGSDYHSNPTAIETYSGEGNEGALLTGFKYKYVGDMDLCNFSSIPLKQQYITDSTALYNNYQSDVAACNGDRVCMANTWRSWQYYQNELRINYVNDLLNQPDYQQCLNDTYAVADNKLKPILDLKRQYRSGVLLEDSKWNASGLLESFHTEYSDFSSDRTGIYPTAVYSLKPRTPVLGFVPLHIENNMMITDEDYDAEPEAQYKYSSGRIVEILNKGGVYTSYVWGYNNTFPIVKAIGVSWPDLSNTYNTVGGNLISLRNHQSMAGALISTYTYSPLLGMLSESDPNEYTRSYTYDRIGRLIVVKDEEGNIIQNYKYEYTER
ncbi:hypothetical protein C900_00445 [Fulvivirga imtechensis AK7]|uniref:YD repeat protein n=1 Tax=Fulvivirga imtechensis AK7 TaxID=1237149 RepID=L8JHL8_9BACT|nr:hypothetical protein [Fulvivirga imtechensis]ELR68346.1 hypothetical protein C900_00445 [Fulvivirga imtechensis AK7]